MITEFVNFELLESTTEQHFLTQVETFNDFQKKQDGFIDAELIKAVKDNAWSFIYHFENMEKLQAAGAKMRASQEFGEFNALLVPGSIHVSLAQQVKTW